MFPLAPLPPPPPSALHTRRAILANGSYVSGPAALPEDETQLSVEICLAAPPGGAGPDAAASDRYRYRLVPLMVRHWETKLWGLRQVVVHRERCVRARGREGG